MQSREEMRHMEALELRNNELEQENELVAETDSMASDAFEELRIHIREAFVGESRLAADPGRRKQLFLALPSSPTEPPFTLSRKRMAPGPHTAGKDEAALQHGDKPALEEGRRRRRVAPSLRDVLDAALARAALLGSATEKDFEDEEDLNADDLEDVADDVEEGYMEEEVTVEGDLLDLVEVGQQMEQNEEKFAQKEDGLQQEEQEEAAAGQNGGTLTRMEQPKRRRRRKRRMEQPKRRWHSYEAVEADSSLGKWPEWLPRAWFMGYHAKYKDRLGRPRRAYTPSCESSRLYLYRQDVMQWSNMPDCPQRAEAMGVNVDGAGSSARYIFPWAEPDNEFAPAPP